MSEERNEGAADDIDGGLQAAHVPIDVATIWIAFRDMSEIAGFLQSKDRIAHFESFKERQRPRVLREKPVLAKRSDIAALSQASQKDVGTKGMTYPFTEALAELEAGIASGRLRATAVDAAGKHVELIREQLNYTYLDIPRKLVEEIETGASVYTRLRVLKHDLIARYPKRDTFAAERFRKPVWDAHVAAYWINKRRSAGFYDIPRPRSAALDFDALVEALQEGRLLAVLDGKNADPKSWFQIDMQRLMKARFEKDKMLMIFPSCDEDQKSREIWQYVNSLAAGGNRKEATADVAKRFSISDAAASTYTVNNPLFRDRKRGRPLGSKNKKGKTVEQQQ